MINTQCNIEFKDKQPWIEYCLIQRKEVLEDPNPKKLSLNEYTNVIYMHAHTHTQCNTEFKDKQSLMESCK